MHYWHDGWHMGGMWFGWILFLLLAAALGGLIASVARRGRRPAEEAPEQILRRRYASGEIDQETYRSMLAELGK